MNSNPGFSLNGLAIFFCNKQIKSHIFNGKLDLNSKAMTLTDLIENLQLSPTLRGNLNLLLRHEKVIKAFFKA